MSSAHRLGKYEIQAALGKGARATVYRGVDSESKRSVAVKVIPRDAVQARALGPFKKYALGLAEIDHPGIARFIEVLETENNVCLVSALAEGHPLSTLLKDGAYPDPRIAWEIVREMLEALAAAHLQGGVHRDLKPSNVMLAPDGHVTLLDFGTSMLYAAPAEVAHYRAPEHFGEGKITLRSDIYQMGMLAYHLVTGKLPFTGAAREIEHRVMQERPTDPSSFNNKLAWQLDWVIQKALSKDPAERFGGALEFGEGLRLGLQDTVGRPLDPIGSPRAGSSQSKAAATPVRSPIAPPADSEEPAATNSATLDFSGAAAAAPIAPEPVARAATPAANLLQNAKLITPAATPKPAPAKTPTAGAAATKLVPDASKPTVLFVDDDARILNALVALFRQDYQVLSAESGEAALALIGQRTPHIVVTDQRMPAMTGVELLRKVRDVAPNAVRILLTGYTDLAALVGSINQGEIFRFVKKPWDNDELRTALADAAKIALELAGTPPPRAQSPRTAGSLLVIEPGSGISRGLERLLAGAASVLQVTTPQEAAKVLAKEEIACIVADMGSGMDGLVALFRELKAKRPEVLSILLTDEPDSELAIELINRAHIFRFLPKPVNAKELRTQVAAALRRYAAFKQIPTLKAAVPGEARPDAAAAERARAMPARPIAKTA